MNRMEILEALERGELSAGKAIALLKKFSSPDRLNKERQADSSVKTRRGHWLKVQVKDDEHNFRFYVPIFMIGFGLFVGNKVIISCYKAEKKNGSDNEGLKIAQNILNSISGQDRKQLMNALRCGGRTDIVRVSDDNTRVVISIV